jgi:small conductance mechanosensitive channel
MLLLQLNDALNTSQVWLVRIKDIALTYGLRLVGAVIAYLIGSWLIGHFTRLLRRVLMARHFDSSLQTFLLSAFRVSMTVMLFLTIVGMLGVNITGFAALLAGAGIAIGAALNGSLGNFSGGVMMLIFKPFKVGDMIEAQGITGVVQEMGIFNTVVLTAENKTVILPNGAVSTGVITNYNTHGNLRVDITMAIAPDASIDEAREVAINAMLRHPSVLKTPMPEVSVLNVGDGMVSLAIRPYTQQQTYWDVYFGVQELVKKAFDESGIPGPVPHRVIVHRTEPTA